MKRSICIVGAGIVGCASAYELAREGHDVVLLDAAPGPGTGCSFANGAQLSYGYVEPLASPATLRALPHLLMQRGSSVRFLPTRDWRQYAWALRFLAACRTARVQAGTRRLLELSFLSRDTLTRWLRDGAWPIDVARNGKLVLCPDEATMARQREQMRFQATLGCEQEALGIDACLQKEPALLPAVRRAPKAFVGGIWTAGDATVDSHSLCLALAGRFESMGGLARFGTRVIGFATREGRVRAVRTSDGEIPCDALVLAAGSAAAQLAQALGEYLPVYPIRGYSLTLPMAAGVPAPRASVTDLGRKTVFAPLGGALRVAAAAEIGGHGLDVPRWRIDQLRAAAAAMYPGSVDVHADGRPWSGLRPATPDSIPIIRRARRYANAFYNVGQGALGLTLAAGSAVLLARLVSGRPHER